MSSFVNKLRARAWWKNALSLLFLLLLIVDICVIYSLSAENGTQSAERSEGIAGAIAGVVVDGYHEMETDEQQIHVDKIHTPLRSAAHFSLFALLGMLAALLVYSLDLTKWYFTLIAPLAFGLFCAILDELHQLSSEGRACDIKDVFMDFAGVVTTVVAVNIVMLIISAWRKRKTDREAS